MADGMDCPQDAIYSRAFAPRVPGGIGEAPLHKQPAGQGPAAARTYVPPPFGQQIGSRPSSLPRPFLFRWRMPIEMFDTALRTVNVLAFVRPLAFQTAGNSNPPVRGQPISSRPIHVSALAGGQANLSRQLGTLKIQAAQLTQDASNYYGG